MPVTKVMQISALKCAPKAFGGRARTQWGSLQRPPDLGGFKSGGRDKGRRKGETTGRDRQLRDGDRNEGRGGRGEGTEESVRRMEAEISQGPAGAPQGTPGDAKCVTEILWEGKNKVGWGQSLKLVN